MNATSVEGWRRLARVAFVVVALAFVAGVTIQIFIAGLAVFVDPLNWVRHVDFVNVLFYMPLLMVFLAIAGSVPRSGQVHSGALLALILVQYFTAHRTAEFPLASASHPVVAMVLFWLSLRVATNGWRLAFASERNAMPKEAKRPIGVHTATAETEL
jgi:hypothetical protein